MNSPKRIITKTIWQLSLVSLFTDMAGEMLYPITPVYLKSIGFSILFIGVLEGFAEAAAGLSKSYFGSMSDIMGRRLPFVQIGYGLSAICRPMMALFVFPAWIFLARTMERLGKGIRTGARDAMLSDESTPATKATVFGFHRSMDTVGAVIGPAIALLYLYFFPLQYKTLFYLAFIPGLLAIISTLFIREKARDHAPATQHKKASFFAFTAYWKKSPGEYRKLLIGLLLFALFNSSDVFLLLKMKENGLNDTMVIAVYIFYNLVYALMAYPIGMLADKIGLKRIFLTGIFIFAAVYIGFAFNKSMPVSFFLFFLYGLYAAATESVSKAWISNIADKKETATAIGTYMGFQSIASLMASSLACLLWYNFGATATFLITAGAALLAVLYLASVKFARK
ncbi:MAG: MFS transporter [Chitinophagaceae bacterium]|nr:MFS transporter [Chitinophagaceae bacterium]